MAIPLQTIPVPRESRPPSTPSPQEVFESVRAREVSLARLLMAYISTGLMFMLLPGTFLGVWNLLQITGRQSVASVSPAWLQAHGHAQVFGWIGSFILGIGFYSVPQLRGTARAALAAAWACWAMWTLGVALRWAANVYEWHWRVLLPFSASLELAAFAVFFYAVARHRPQASSQSRLEPWVWVVISASAGWWLALVANLRGTIDLSVHGLDPAFPHGFDQRFVVLMAWGFLAPFVWGFSGKWLPVFLGLNPTRPRLLLVAVAINFAGVVLTFFGWGGLATGVFVLGAVVVVAALRIFERSRKEAKTRSVHSSFPFFVRMAYAWLLVAAALGVVAARWDSSGGIWGASRHALTVGFIAMMVLCVGQRILPAFAGMRLLWSAQLMWVACVLLTVGCALRVSCQVLAYQGYAAWAWSILPASGILELTGLTAFATNIFGTFLLVRSHAQKQPLLVTVPR